MRISSDVVLLVSILFAIDIRKMVAQFEMHSEIIQTSYLPKNITRTK